MGGILPTRKLYAGMVLPPPEPDPRTFADTRNAVCYTAPSGPNRKTRRALEAKERP